MQRILLFVLLSLAFLGFAQAGVGGCNAGCTDCFGILCRACGEGYGLYGFTCYECPYKPFCGTCSVSLYSSTEVKKECTGPSKVGLGIGFGVAVFLILCCYCMCSGGSSQRNYQPKPLSVPMVSVSGQYGGHQGPVVGYGTPFGAPQQNTNIIVSH